MASKTFTDLDFDGIRDSLKAFLNSQTEFTGHDFEGSALTVITNLLANNTHNLAYLANMIGNEAFIDSAQLRASIVSAAKRMSYTPRSNRSSIAVVDLVVTPFDAGNAPTYITMNRGTQITAKKDNKSYVFVNREALTANKIDGIYTFSNVSMYQGRYLTYSFSVDNVRQQFRIPNKDVDTTSLIVKVQNSVSDTASEVYKEAGSILGVKDSSNVYYLSEDTEGYFNIEFGDGVLGKSLDTENIINIEYIVCSGDMANNIPSFTALSDIDGYNDIKITTVAASIGGAILESEESIRFTAPKMRAAQQRAVTPSDYEIIIKKEVPQASDVRAWGGEDNDPPRYGTVYASIKPVDGFVISDLAKKTLANVTLKKYNVGSITPVLVDPEYTTVTVSITAVYDDAKLVGGSNSLKVAIQNAVKAYSINSLSSFNKRLRASVLTGIIDKVDDAMINSYFTMSFRKPFTVATNVEQKNIIQFNNPINTGSVEIKGFRISDPTTTDNLGNIYYINDVSGVLHVYRDIAGVKTKVVSNVGTVDYTVGTVDFSINLLDSDNASIDVVAVPALGDIESVRNNIIVIDESNINITLEID